MPLRAGTILYATYIQTQLGFGQYRSPGDTTESGHTSKQRFGIPLGHHFPALLERTGSQKVFNTLV